MANELINTVPKYFEMPKKGPTLGELHVPYSAHLVGVQQGPVLPLLVLFL